MLARAAQKASFLLVRQFVLRAIELLFKLARAALAALVLIELFLKVRGDAGVANRKSPIFEDPKSGISDQTGQA